MPGEIIMTIQSYAHSLHSMPAFLKNTSAGVYWDTKECDTDSAQRDQEDDREKFRHENQQATRRRADSLVAMAEAFLRDTKVASTTDDRYQVIVNVDSNVLAKKVFEKPDGTPDCYIDGQVALPVETARRLSCSCKVSRQ